MAVNQVLSARWSSNAEFPTVWQGSRQPLRGKGQGTGSCRHGRDIPTQSQEDQKILPGGSQQGGALRPRVWSSGEAKGMVLRWAQADRPVTHGAQLSLLLKRPKGSLGCPLLQILEPLTSAGAGVLQGACSEDPALPTPRLACGGGFSMRHLRG